MKRFIFILSLLGLVLPSFSSAQVFIDTSATAEQMVMDFFDQGCVSISNVTFTGEDVQLAFFQGAGTSLGMNAGILLSTGNVFIAQGPNLTSSAGFAIPGSPDDGDDDLEMLVPGNSNDAAVLEFDLTTTDPDLDFRYIFASEEYPEFVGSIFNDAFAFIIYEVGVDTTNIAMVPGSNLPVSINNVNDTTNAQYYVDNTGDLDLEFDGRTIDIPASFTANTSITYHIKIVVADYGDSIFDSAIFLGIESLCGDSLLTPPSNFQASLINPDGNTVEFENRSSYATDFLWKFGDGNTSTEKSPTHTYAQDGMYEVELITYNYCCSDTSSAEVVIGQVTSIDPDLELPYRIFPNPFQEMVQVDLPAQLEGTIRLFDHLGRLNHQERVRGQTVLDLSYLPKGIYMLQLETADGRFTSRVTKQ
ncbi:MAG: choice-of-anchor L domain-containing protein [Bacteroidota bacterium]